MPIVLNTTIRQFTENPMRPKPTMSVETTMRLLPLGPGFAVPFFNAYSSSFVDSPPTWRPRTEIGNVRRGVPAFINRGGPQRDARLGRYGHLGQPFLGLLLCRCMAREYTVDGVIPARIRMGLPIAFFLASALTLAPIAAGDGTGSGITTSKGSYLLTPVGTAYEFLHAYLSDLGVQVSPGDTLIFSWQANNGTGPPIYFEIHAHPYGAYIQYYNTTSSSVGNGTFTAHEPYSYMVFWKNLSNTTRVNLTYSFVLLLSQPSLWPLYA